MISRRQIRIKVMQAVYAWYCTDYHPAKTFEYNLAEFADEIRDHERQKGDKGDLRLLTDLFYGTIERGEQFDDMIQQKAENWELERIALLDRILMQMGICEMLSFEEIPIKVTINEYLEIAKKFSTPKSSKFINGILDSLYIEMKDRGDIQKRGRGLIEESIPKGRPGGPGRRKRPRVNKGPDMGPPRGHDGDRMGPPRHGPGPDRDRERSGPPRPRIVLNRNRDRDQMEPPPPEMDGPPREDPQGPPMEGPEQEFN